MNTLWWSSRFMSSISACNNKQTSAKHVCCVPMFSCALRDQRSMNVQLLLTDYLQIVGFSVFLVWLLGVPVPATLPTTFKSNQKQLLPIVRVRYEVPSDSCISNIHIYRHDDSRTCSVSHHYRLSLGSESSHRIVESSLHGPTIWHRHRDFGTLDLCNAHTFFAHRHAACASLYCSFQKQQQKRRLPLCRRGA